MGSSVTKPFRDRFFPSENGMTLLETLAAISLTAVLLGILSQLLFSGVRLWGKQSASYRLQHQQSLVFQNLTMDFERLVARTYLPEPALAGNELKMACWDDTATGLMRVIYTYKPDEKSVCRLAGLWGQTPAETLVINEVQDWKFEYYNPKTASWTGEWSPKLKSQLPCLIKVTAVTKYGRFRPMIFPLKPGDKETE
jgi:type II secretory pathway pseudopilin PulG